jgi:hypothetical protein
MRHRILCILLFLAVGGCGGPPPPEVYNEHLVAAIQFAIAKRDPYWLDQYANRAKSCWTSGQLTDAQHQGLQSIIKKARRGDWSGANTDIEQFRRQRASIQAE